MVKRERDFVQEVIDIIPEQIKTSFDNEAIKQFATAVVENEKVPKPNTGEMTSSQRRMFGPISPFNGYFDYGLYQSANLPLNVLDLMRRDSQVALGLAIVKFPITQLNYTINCKNLLIKEFIKFNLENKWSSIIKDSLKSLDFGFTPFEKVWEKKSLSIDPGKNARKARNRNFICLEKLKALNPASVKVRVDSKGNFAGINQGLNGFH